MDEITLTSTGFPSGRIRLTYTASNGTLTITKIEGTRTDGYHSYNVAHKSFTMTVDNVPKTITLGYGGYDGYIEFLPNNEWSVWTLANSISWTGLPEGNVSISAKMPPVTNTKDPEAYGDKVFTGTINMPYDTYTVTYNANGGSGSIPAGTKKYGEEYTITSSEPEKTGYTFTGWNTQQNGTGTSYKARDIYYTNADMTLYAQWTPTEYKFIYHKNDGSGVTKNISSFFDSEVEILSPTNNDIGFSKSDASFVGWSTDPNGLSGPYYVGMKGTRTEASDTNLYALWLYNPQIKGIYKYRGYFWPEGDPLKDISIYDNLIIRWDVPQFQGSWRFLDSFPYENNPASFIYFEIFAGNGRLYPKSTSGGNVIPDLGPINPLPPPNEHQGEYRFRYGAGGIEFSYHIGRLDRLGIPKLTNEQLLSFIITPTIRFQFTNGHVESFQSKASSQKKSKKGTVYVYNNKWVKGQLFVNTDSQWKEATSIRVKTDDGWKEST